MATPSESWIQVGGTSYEVSVTASAVATVEEAFNVSVLDGSFMRAISRPAVLRSLTYQAMLAADPTLQLTEQQLGRMMHLGNAGAVAKVLLAQMQSSYSPQDARYLAPFVPTPDEVSTKAFSLIDMGSGGTVLDIGCGTGNVLVVAGRDFGARRLIGYELDVIRKSRCLVRCKAECPTGTVVDIRREDGNHVRAEDVHDADVIFVYLLTQSNVRIMPRLVQSMRAGTIVVSHDFSFPSWPLWRFDTILDGSGTVHQLFAYRAEEILGLEPASIA